MTATVLSRLAPLAALFVAVFARPAFAEPLTEAQGQALRALEMEFDVHHVTGTEAEREKAFASACEAGYNLACQRGAWVVYGTPDLPTAADLFGTACESGDSVACMVVGWNLDRNAVASGDRDRSWRSAAKLFRDQCDAGFQPACHDWGWFLYQNKGFKADPKSGIARWKKACDAGELASCTTLGALTVEGAPGIPANPREGATYLDKACNGGFAEACYQKAQLAGAAMSADERDRFLGAQCDAGHRMSCWALAQSYLNGSIQAPSQDRVDALLARGCDTGNGNSCFEAGRRETAKDKPDYGVAADRFARACSFGEMSGCTAQVELITGGKVQGSVKTAPQAFETACLKRNSAIACTELAMELMRGVDLARDPTRARALLHRACVSPESAARPCVELGHSYAEGMGGPRDRTTAAKFYRWACEAGDPRACELRGDLLLSGKGITRDDHDALAMYTKACEAGVAAACNKGGVILDEGTYVKRDAAGAQAMYQKACDGNDGAGCHGLGKMLEAGASGSADPVAARAAYERGAALGSVDAIREMARMLWDGLGGKKQRGKARQLAAKACQLGDAVACRGAEAI